MVNEERYGVINSLWK